MLSQFFKVQQHVQALDSITGIWFTAIILSFQSAWEMTLKWENFNCKPTVLSIDQDERDATLNNQWPVREVMANKELSGRRARKHEIDVGYKKDMKSVFEEVN
jgi:hypothetical protein